MFELLDVVFLLGVLDRKDFHEEIGRVGETGHLELEALEVVHRLTRVTLVHDVPVSHQDESVEVVEGVGRGLMDGAHDGFTLVASKFVQAFANTACFERVKSGGGLVEHEKRGVGNKFESN